MSDNRALSAALSGPVFHGAASRSALHASDRHVERWAPEGEGATRGGGMRSLAFADRVVSPWMAGSNSAASRMFSSYASSGTRDRAAPEVSWLFPRPWFQDELDWMAAARQGLEETPRASALTTRGTFMRTREAGDAGWSQLAMPVLAPPIMAAVAPSMRPSALPEPGPLAAARMWSPSVPFAAAAAAEVVAGAMRSVEASGLPGVAERSPIWSGLAVVRPSELAPSSSSIPASSIPASSAPAAFTASLAAAPRVSPIAQVAAVDAARASIERIDARVDVMRASALPTATESFAPSADGAASVEASGSLSAAEHRLADAAHGSSQASAALRTVELLLAAVAERTSRTSAAVPSGGASSGAVEAARTAEPVRVPEVARASETAANFAPVVGPRVAMPAGLGGLVTSMETARAVGRPMVQPREAMTSPFAMPLAALERATSFAPSTAPVTAGPSAAAPGGTFAPIWAARPASALAAVAEAPVRGVDHLTWSDRWLARFAGASPVALQSFDNGAESIAPSLRTLSAGAPEIVYVHPTLGPAAIAATAARSPVVAPLAERTRPTIASPRPSAPLRIDDGEAVPDAVFAAIAAAATAPAPRVPSGAPSASVGAQPVVTAPASGVPASGVPAMAPEMTREQAAVLAPVDLVAARGPASIADLAAISVPTAPDAGLASGLASSPMAAALAAVMPMTSAPVFDPRALRGAAVAEAYLGGLLARAASPVGVLTGAPTMMNLAAAGVSPAGMSLGGTGLGAANWSPGSPAAVGAAGGGEAASDESASMRWSLRDLALAPVQLRLAAAAPDRTFVALGGDVPITLRASRADAAAQQAASVNPRALPAAAWALSPAALAAMQTAAATAAGVSATGVSSSGVPASEAGRLPRPEARTEASEMIAGAAVAERASAERAAAERASAEQAAAEHVAVERAAAEHATVARAAERAAAEHAAVQHAVQHAAVERELLGLRSALLASPTSAAAVPLAHAAHAPLVSSTTSVPSLDLPFALPALAGIGHGTTSPLGAAMARHAATQLSAPRPAAAAFVGGQPAEAPDGAEDVAASSRVAGLAGPMPVVALDGREVTPRLHAPTLALGRPGSLAESALAWSIGESRVAGGLSYDFVTPEMVLAARVYGLPAGAAAEAMRVAAGGPSAMASLAASLDLTFLRAFQGPGTAAAAATAAPTSAAGVASAARATPMPALVPSAPSAVGAGFDAAPGAPATSAVERPAAEAAGLDPSMDPGLVWASGTPGMWPTRGGAAVGTGRAPRGAYLWPSATAAALGLNAMSPEGVAGLPVVALELLAAQAVAELGTWVTAFPRGDGAIEAMIAAGGAGAGPRAAAMAAMSGGAAVGATGAPAAFTAAAPGAAPVAGLARAPGVDAAAGDEFAEAAESAAAWSMPALARQRFESVYVALARSAEGQSLSPSARAARAMSLLTRGDGETRTTRQLAAEAWTVLPHVYRGDLDLVAGESARAADVEAGLGDARPGLAGLAARAGDLLGSFVHPSMAEVRSAGGAEPMRGPAGRVEAPIYVENAPAAPRPAPSAGFTASRPGRTFTQFGGGEVEIPAWFEAAAEKMFSGSGDDRAAATLAQMVLVTSMPQQQIAAATKGGSTSGGGGGAPQQGGGKQGGVEKPDVERLAHEVYQEVMALLELTRIRSGDPFQ